MPSVSSRTAYVLLSAIEEDFRAVITSFAEEAQAPQVLGQERYETATGRRRRDGFKSETSNISALLPYVDFKDAFDVALGLKDKLPVHLLQGLRGLVPAVERLVPVRNRVAHNRPLEVDDLPCVVDIAADLERVEGWDWAKIRESRVELGNDPGYIYRAAANLIVDPDTAVANNLPSPDYDETSLLGRREERRSISRALRGAWPVISILGDGGIGKTALALQVCYDLVGQKDCPFDAVVWVTAKNAQLTSSEIVRIETAVEDSLGLFASATAALGGSGDPARAITELLEVLGTFPTLVVLDNVETVLDEDFPRLLRDIPVGSKVLITSRIGVKTENPFKLSGLSIDDSKKLMRILARSRGLRLESLATEDQLGEWAKRMNCHPAYIKWFVSGLQTGQAPEKLLNDNGLVLEFCMSNVFGFLSADARAALEAMLVVPGSHTMAELAFLTGFDSSSIQSVVLELTTTNFVAHVRGGASGSALELSDFARPYLRSKLSVARERRQLLTERQRQLYVVGGGIQQAHALNPYSTDTIDVRGVGDYSAARLLREALERSSGENYDEALRLSGEAADLAPGYHEAARVEAYIHESSMNFTEAHDAYLRARDLAPNDPYVAYFLGRFLRDSGFDPELGIREMQRAAKLDSSSSFLQLEICQSHLARQDFGSAAEASAYAIAAAEADSPTYQDAIFFLWRATAYAMQASILGSDFQKVSEDLDFALTTIKGVPDFAFSIATLDVMLWAAEMADEARQESAEDYVALRLRRSVDAILGKCTSVDESRDERRVGFVQNLVQDGGYGFLASRGQGYFFHARQLWDRREYESLTPGATVIFTPGKTPAAGKPEALSVHWVG